MELFEIMNQIKDRFENDMILENEKFLSIFADFAPQKIKEKRQLKALLELNIGKKLYDICGYTQIEQQNELLRIIKNAEDETALKSTVLIPLIISLCVFLNFQPETYQEIIQDFENEFEKDANESRISLLDNIKNIRISSYRYKVSVGSPILNETNIIIVTETGSNCYKKIVWGNERFAPNPGRKKQDRNLNVYYSLGGKDKIIKAKIPLDNFDDLWSFGVMINEDFTIQFFLGNDNNYTQSEKYILELE